MGTGFWNGDFRADSLITNAAHNYLQSIHATLNHIRHTATRSPLAPSIPQIDLDRVRIEAAASAACPPSPTSSSKRRELDDALDELETGLAALASAAHDTVALAPLPSHAYPLLGAYDLPNALWYLPSTASCRQCS